MATRTLWPAVVGSRWSMAVTDGGLDEALEDQLDLPVQPRVLEGDGRLTGERADEPDLAVGIREDPAAGGWLVGDPRRRLALTVDELEHADHLVAVVEHRHDEDRLGAVAEALVEAAVERVRRLIRQHVRVLEHQRLAVHGGVAGKARRVEREREPHDRQIRQRVVRGQREAELRRAVAALDEVDAAGVALREPLRLLEDADEQAVGVALGHERHTDPGQLAQLVARAAQLALGAGRGQPGGGVLERGAQDPERAFRVGVAGQDQQGPAGVGHAAFGRLVGRDDDDPARHVLECAARVVRGGRRGAEQQHGGRLGRMVQPGQRVGEHAALDGLGVERGLDGGQRVVGRVVQDGARHGGRGRHGSALRPGVGAREVPANHAVLPGTRCSSPSAATPSSRREPRRSASSRSSLRIPRSASSVRSGA